MKLNEIKQLTSKESLNYFIVKSYNGLEPDGQYVEPFNVKVTYYSESPSSSDHPYGDGHATEMHSGSVSLHSVLSDEEVKVWDEEGKHVIKTFPKGTKLSTIPGWTSEDEKYFQQLAEKDSSVNEDLGNPTVVQIEKGLTREEALKKAPWKKAYGDCRGFTYDAKSGKATWI